MRICYWLWLLSLSTAIPAAEVVDVGEPEAPFANDTYKLGYEVYLQRGNLAAAFALAAKAIRAQPDNAEWLKRYAQAAEWVAKPSLALKAWLALARNTNSNEAWQAVARLAPSLLNDEALLAYQQHQLVTQPDSQPLIITITQTYERMGQLSAGLAFLAQLDKRHPSQALSEAQAGLAERGGEPKLALVLLTTLINRYGAQETWVLRRAAVHYALGELDEAWTELHLLAPKMPVKAAGFWQTYAELSRILNHPENAAQAYKVLVDNNQARPSDLRNYVDALQNKDGQAAAHLSALLFSQGQEGRDLITALYLYRREHRLDAAAQLLTSLKPEQLTLLQQSPGFLEQRGYVYWQQQHYRLARADFERALRLAPSNVRLVQSLVGIIIDQKDNEALTTILTGLQARAQAQPLLWSVWASGWNLLNQPQKALPFLQAYSKAHADNDLVLLGLADTYASNNNLTTATKLRKRVLARQHLAPTSAATQPQAALVQDALLAMALNDAPPAASLNALRARLKLNNGVFDARDRELVLIWLLAHDHEDQASNWLARAYRGNAPVWALTNVAFQQNEPAAVQNLLNTAPEQLPRYARIQIANDAGQPAQAESMAFASADSYPDDDEQYRLYRDLMSQRSSWAELTAENNQQSILQRRGLAVAWSGRMNAYWRLQLHAEHHQQSSRDTNRLQVPTDDNRLTLQLTSPRYAVGLSHIDALQRVLGVNVGQDIVLSRDLSFGWRADYNAEATESITLLTMGVKDQLQAKFNWAMTRKDYLASELSAANYHSQTRQSLGNGQMLNLEFGHRLFLDKPQQTLRVVAVVTRFNADSQPLEPQLQALIPSTQDSTSAFFMPMSYQQIGVYWNIGEPVPSVYSPTWRYFGELGANYASATGSGYGVRVGVHGSLLGNDRLTLSIEQSKGGKNEGDQTTIALLNYRYFY